MTEFITTFRDSGKFQTFQLEIDVAGIEVLSLALGNISGLLKYIKFGDMLFGMLLSTKIAGW